MDEATMNEAKTLIEAESQATGAGAIPWTVILQILMQILQGCIKPPAGWTGAGLKEMASSRPLFTRWLTTRAARDVLGADGGFRTVHAATNAALNSVAKADPVLVEKFANAG